LKEKIKLHKHHNIGDITYILKEYSDYIPEKLIQDFMFELYDYMPLEEESK